MRQEGGTPQKGGSLGFPLLSLFCLARLLPTNSQNTRLARLQSEVGTKDVGGVARFLMTAKCSGFRSKLPLFVGTRKIPTNPRQTSNARLPSNKKQDKFLTFFYTSFCPPFSLSAPPLPRRFPSPKWDLRAPLFFVEDEWQPAGAWFWGGVAAQKEKEVPSKKWHAKKGRIHQLFRRPPDYSSNLCPPKTFAI